MKAGNPFIFGSKGQRSRSQRLCVGLQTERNIDAGCVRKPRWVFPGVGFCTLVSAGFF